MERNEQILSFHPLNLHHIFHFIDDIFLLKKFNVVCEKRNNKLDFTLSISPQQHTLYRVTSPQSPI